METLQVILDAEKLRQAAGWCDKTQNNWTPIDLLQNNKICVQLNFQSIESKVEFQLTFL